MYIPTSPFISSQFDYLTYIIISALLIILKKFWEKKESYQDLIEDELIYNEPNILLEFGVKKGDYFLFINLIFVVIKDLFDPTTDKFNCLKFSYWMFEMLYYEIFNSKVFKYKIYKHHIYSLIFLLSSCSIIKSVYLIICFTHDTKIARFFEDKKWLIPISIIIFFLYRVFKSYTFSNEKYYLEKRTFSIINYILLYGIIGLIITSLGGIISTYVPCGDETIPKLSKTVCDFKENNQTYYFDSYKIYFNKLYSEYFIQRLILIFFKSILNYLTTYYIYVIFKKLRPTYYLCMYRLAILIVSILGFINGLINAEMNALDTSLNICDLFTLFCYISGATVYLEFIELNFCNLNFYTKKNIKKRSNTDILISLDSISESSENSFKEMANSPLNQDIEFNN